MHTTNLRKVGGSVMLAVPRPILDLLRLRAGSTVGLTIDGERLVIDPRPRPHYTIEELLTASDYSVPQPQCARDLEREWLDSPPVGRELL
jgi:antitoxin ChpS